MKKGEKTNEIERVSIYKYSLQQFGMGNYEFLLMLLESLCNDTKTTETVFQLFSNVNNLYIPSDDVLNDLKDVTKLSDHEQSKLEKLHKRNYSHLNENIAFVIDNHKCFINHLKLPYFTLVATIGGRLGAQRRSVVDDMLNDRQELKQCMLKWNGWLWMYDVFLETNFAMNDLTHYDNDFDRLNWINESTVNRNVRYHKQRVKIMQNLMSNCAFCIKLFKKLLKYRPHSLEEIGEYCKLIETITEERNNENTNTNTRRRPMARSRVSQIVKDKPWVNSHAALSERLVGLQQKSNNLKLLSDGIEWQSMNTHKLDALLNGNAQITPQDSIDNFEFNIYSFTINFLLCALIKCNNDRFSTNTTSSLAINLNENKKQEHLVWLCNCFNLLKQLCKISPQHVGFTFYLIDRKLEMIIPSAVKKRYPHRISNSRFGETIIEKYGLFGMGSLTPFDNSLQNGESKIIQVFSQFLNLASKEIAVSREYATNEAKTNGHCCSQMLVDLIELVNVLYQNKLSVQNCLFLCMLWFCFVDICF